MILKIVVAVIISITIALFVTAGVVYFTGAMMDADEISCNWIFCEFKKTYSNVIVHESRTCQQDGEPINCSELDRLK